MRNRSKLPVVFEPKGKRMDRSELTTEEIDYLRQMNQSAAPRLYANKAIEQKLQQAGFLEQKLGGLGVSREGKAFLVSKRRR